jgi:membrane protease YdiL (CAAX protease family)
MSRRYLSTALLILATLVGALAVSGVQALFVWMPPVLGLMYEAAITLVALALWYRWQHDAWQAALPRPGRSWQVVAMATLCCVSLSAAYGWWIPPTQPSLLRAATTNWGRTSLILAGVLTAPLLEEALIRGFLLGRLRKSFGATTSTLLSGATFAIAHDDSSRIVPQFAAGIVLGAVVICTGRLWLAVATHSALNLGAFLELGTYHIDLSGRLGPLFPILCLVAAIVAALGLRRVLVTTRWRVSRPIPPHSWRLRSPGASTQAPEARCPRCPSIPALHRSTWTMHWRRFSRATPRAVARSTS